MIEQITVPDIGENVESGSVVGVLVSPGDVVEKDDGIIEFETDKAVVEIPSPAKGKIIDVLVKVGDELKIGAPIATLETHSDDVEAAPEKPAEAATPAPRKKEIHKEQEVISEQIPTDKPVDGQMETDKPIDGRMETDDMEPSVTPDTGKIKLPAPAAPSVRRLARELGVDIHAVKGSGRGGRISEKDVKNYLKDMATSHPRTQAVSVSDSMPVADLPDFSRWGPVDSQDLSTVRRITAENMTRSWRIVPQVTQFDRADITQLGDWIETVNRKLTKTGVKLTITAILLKVIAEGLKQFPRFNASLDLQKQQMIYKHYTHVGLAVDTDRGLLVPVVRDVDRKSITDIAGEILDLADRARRKRLQPDEMEGGTFTLSNQGGIGGTQFTPIVYWPQAAILGVSRAAMEPHYMDGHWEPRTVLPLALSYDHRINDGADAARFLKWICEALQHPFAMHL
jgi:pyruvate dehydrogenase E2 component (dihydrolipoyllysine-residue acetyltransferase)